ncbi:hypothetical protein LEN26_018906 [Aphanomyces euteiches]|nr:hypothetical protein LEN26_018906 [Aphanomyces euteiches]
MKKSKRDSVALPSEVVINLALYLEEWETVKLFLEAFRPTNLLGPLENLRQLEILGWTQRNLWPRLYLTLMDEESLQYVQGVAKYYTKVFVDDKIDVDWFSCNFGPETSIIYLGSDVGPSTLIKWKGFRITAVNYLCRERSKFVESLSYLNYLKSLTLYECTVEMAATIFKFAAMSSSLRRLKLATFARAYDGQCTVTTSMANDLLQWIISQPIQNLSLANFN